MNENQLILSERQSKKAITELHNKHSVFLLIYRNFFRSIIKYSTLFCRKSDLKFEEEIS